MRGLAKRRDIAVVVAVHEPPRGTPSWIAETDYIITNDKYIAKKYLDEVGAICSVLPRALDWDQIVLERRQEQNVTILGESSLSIRIADRIRRGNPEIPIMVAGSSLHANPSASVVHHRRFLDYLANAKILVIPNHWNERLMTPAFEAMANGIPVLVGDCDGFFEVFEDGDCVVKRRFRHENAEGAHSIVEDADPWSDAVIRLWDDELLRRQAAENAIKRARRSHFDSAGGAITSFFKRIRPAPGPPAIPKVCGSPSTSVSEMIELIKSSPPGHWPAGWPHWENVKLSHRLMANEFLNTLPSARHSYNGRGIVIAGGGHTYFACAWICIRVLRELGCELPVQLWYLGEGELDAQMERLVAPFDVRCIDAHSVAATNPCRILSGWGLKPYMIKHAPFKDVLLLDADNIPVRDPTFLFDSAEYQRQGAIFWPDFYERGSTDVRHYLSPTVWSTFGVAPRDEPTIESGQLLVDKERCWRDLNLSLWYTEHADWTYAHVYGDKDCFHIAWRSCGSDYAIPATLPIWTGHTILQHDFQGARIFQHRCRDKWTLNGSNKPNRRLVHEEMCFGFLSELSRLWDGKINLERLRF
jgi:hypothetical protein